MSQLTSFLSNLVNRVPGMDSSLWDDKKDTIKVPDFQQSYNEGLYFNYLKTSQGTFIDPCYKRDWLNCRKTPLYLGNYHFLQWNIEPKKQAEFFFKNVEKDQGELPLICDFEWWNSYVPSNAFDILYNFLERMKQLTNHQLGIYTGYYFWKDYGKIDNYWSQYILWLAQYSKLPPLVPKPWKKYHFWQYTDKGDGLRYGMESKSVDLNYFMGTMNEFIDFCGNVKKDENNNDDENKEEDEEDMLKMEVVSDKLNVRSGPNTSYSSLQMLLKGNIVTVYNVGGVYGSWVQISPDKSEWCCVQNGNGIYLRKI